MSQNQVLVERHDAVARITLNRPEALNALSQGLIASLCDTFRGLSEDRELRAIVLTGAGRAFSVGVDLKELAEQDGAIDKLGQNTADGLHQIVQACPHPVISAVNGYAITGGLEVAMMADFILAGEAAIFADTHARVGITPGWGLSQILPRLIGVNRARQMSLTGEFVTAETACAWGLANEVLPDDTLLDRAHDLARQIAETDRSTLTKIRGLISESQNLTLAEGLKHEGAVMSSHITQVSPDSVAKNRAKVTQRGQTIAKAAPQEQK